MTTPTIRHLRHTPPGRRPRAGGEEGQVTAFVTIMVAGLLLSAGLVLDGGLALGAKVRAIDEAQEAARTGAQQIDLAVYRDTGEVVLIPARATAAARAYLTAAGAQTVSVTVAGDTVTVTAARTQPAQILGVVGIGSLVVTGTATAHTVHGVGVESGP